jgi:hypothetical protein
MWPPRAIDEALEDAVTLDAFADYDLTASRRQIARDVADVLMFDNAAAHAAGITRRHPARPSGRFPTLHDQATKDLHALSAQALHRSDAAGSLAQLANTCRIDPDGALHFACLLHLADHQEGAQFWWQFAAGAGNPTAAYCLYLLHLGRGELRDAEHWIWQAAELDDAATSRVGRLNVRCTNWPRRRRPSPALCEAVRRLKVDQDDELGCVPHPDPGLADQIEELVGAL